MEPNLEAIVRRALAEAQAAGKDYLTQTEEAVRAVRQAFPDMTASDAFAQVNRLRVGTDGPAEAATAQQPETVNFLEFLGTEQTNLLVSFNNFRHEFDVFSHVDRLYQTAVSNARATKDDDMVVLQLLLFVHFHFYHSAATLLRCHLSEALASMRTAIDAALTAYRIIEDRSSQLLYIERDKSFQFPKAFFRKAWKENSDAFPLAKPLLNLHDACSQYGSHADIDSFVHRLDLPETSGDMLKLHYFQHPKNHWDFAWFFWTLIHTYLINLQVFEKFLVEEKGFVNEEWSKSIPRIGAHIENMREEAKQKANAEDK